MHAQNLVNNPGFEQFSICPDYVSQINYCTGWERPTEGTSDYFNRCLGVPFSVSIPDNQFGIQQPATGNGYAGVYAFYSPVPFTTVPDEDREYLTSQLVQPLQPGETYYAEFKVSLAEAARYAVNDMGLLVSMTKPVRNDELAITHIPQVTYTGQAPISDKSGWTVISGCFTADSAYEHITIGNFDNGMNTVAVDVGTQTSALHYSYYYIDDVVLMKIEKPVIEKTFETCSISVLSISNFNDDFNYQWSNGLTDSAITVVDPGYYWCAVYIGDCMVTSDSIYVEINEPVEFSLGNDTLVNFCNLSMLFLDPVIDPTAQVTYYWSNGAVSKSIAISEPGLYILTVTDPQGCSVADSVMVEDGCETSLYIPNAFSPNGDGRNEYFKIAGENIELLNFTVFNRWGGMVFETRDLDGYWNGENAPSGLYAWETKYRQHKKPDAPVITRIGYLFLIR